jgi:Protein of unknown function (DUF2029).
VSHSGLSVPEQVARSRVILWAFVLVALALVAQSAVRFQAPELLGQEKVLTDFDAFHIAGTLAGRGDVADAYHAETMKQAQLELTGKVKLMPWTYPPPFTLFVDGLARLPIGTAYVLFILASFGFYLAVLRRIAGEYLPGVLLFMMPTILINLRTGQNGFLVAGLIGAFLIAWRRQSPAAGLPLGLMIIKPHLAAGVGLLALFGKRWSVLAIAAIVAAGALGLATLAYGFAVWDAFRDAVEEAGAFLSAGLYPLYRMNSLYAALHAAGLPAGWAMAGHALGALTALGLLVWTCTSTIAFRFRAALICALSLFVSPYNYDYDLAILGVGLAFILPDLIARRRAGELAGLLALCWLACGYGVVANALAVPEAVANADIAQSSGWLSLIGPILIAFCLLTGRYLGPVAKRTESPGMIAPTAQINTAR